MSEIEKPPTENTSFVLSDVGKQLVNRSSTVFGLTSGLTSFGLSSSEKSSIQSARSFRMFSWFQATVAVNGCHDIRVYLAKTYIYIIHNICVYMYILYIIRYVDILVYSIRMHYICIYQYVSTWVFEPPHILLQWLRDSSCSAISSSICQKPPTSTTWRQPGHAIRCHGKTIPELPNSSLVVYDFPEQIVHGMPWSTISQGCHHRFDLPPANIIHALAGSCRHPIIRSVIKASSK